MLKIDRELKSIPATREAVVALLESTNSPIVNLPAQGSAATLAHVFGVASGPGMYSVYVYLRQPENGDAVTIYVSEPRSLALESYRVEEAEAVRFLESMGFQIERKNFRGLSAPEQIRELERIGAFSEQRSSVIELTEALSDPPPPMGPAEIFGGLPRAQREAFERVGTAQRMRPGASVPDTQAFAIGPPTARITRLELEAVPAVAERPSDSESLQRIGRLLSTFVLAVTLFGCAHQSPSEDLPAEVVTQIDIGNTQLKDGLWSQAITTFNAILKERDNTRDALYGLGLAYFGLGHRADAEKYFRNTIEVAPDWSMAKNSLASLLIDDGRCDEALTLADAARKDIFYPTTWFADFHYARAQECLGRPKEAITALRTTLKQNPHFCAAYLSLSNLSFKIKDYDLTVNTCADFEQKCTRDSIIGKLLSPEHDCMCDLNSGHAYVELGDIESARSAFASCQSEGVYGKQCRAALQMLPQ